MLSQDSVATMMASDIARSVTDVVMKSDEAKSFVVSNTAVDKQKATDTIVSGFDALNSMVSKVTGTFGIMLLIVPVCLVLLFLLLIFRRPNNNNDNRGGGEGYEAEKILSFFLPEKETCFQSRSHDLKKKKKSSVS